MRNFLSLLCIGILCAPLCSCGGGGARAGAKAAQAVVKSFAKNAGRNSSKFVSYAKKPGIVKTRNGRLVPYNQAANLGKIRIPSPNNLSIIRNSRIVNGSVNARSAVAKSEIDLLLYDSHGNVILYANKIDNALIYSAARRAYQGKAVNLVDDVYSVVSKAGIKSEAELQQLVSKTIHNHMGSGVSRPYVFDVSTGQLTFNVEFANGSQIVGSIDVFATVKRGLIFGAGGYYVVKKT